ncbi:MAG: hypothetical protein IPN95_28520 [Bacteroidetes bacterium]|nr:hypothetical protein [Bacteroidota bacterium]
MGTYVGKWDCPKCGTKRILGWENGQTVVSCPACGGPSTGKWYLDSRDMEISEAGELALAKSKRAWQCGHCDKVNDGSRDTCISCGNPRDKDSGDDQFIAREYDPRDVPQTGEEVENPSVESPTENAAASVEGISARTRSRWDMEAEAKRQRRNKILKIVGIAAGSLALLIFVLTWKKEIPVMVSGFSWERTIDIEKYGPHSESSWDSPPPGAYGISSAQEIHHYDTRVVGRECHTETYSTVCGTTDNGNGTFSDQYCTETREVCEDQTVQDPVYATRYYYTIDRWGFDHTETTTAKDQSPHWPVFSLTTSSPERYREGKKKETYTVHLLRKSGKPASEDVAQDRWSKMKSGQWLTGYRNVIFGYWMGLKDNE